MRYSFRFAVLLGGCCLSAICHGFAIQQERWMFQGHPIAYDLATPTTATTTSPKKTQPMLLLNGFGVGSFHQHRLMEQLQGQATDRIIYTMDYLGQGRSWPENCEDGMSPSEKGLIYSGDM